MKRCPYCAEEIQDEAVKCKHCSTMLTNRGSDPRCAICFSDKDLQPFHAAIVYLNDRFYLENPYEKEDVFVNDISLSKGDLIPLNIGDRIQIVRLAILFNHKYQLYLNK